MKLLAIISTLLLVVFISACSPSTTNPQIVHCDENNNEYIFQEKLNVVVESDEQAFDILKQYWTVYDPKGGVHISEGIPSDMSVEEAMTGILFRKNVDIQTDNGPVEGVWMLYNLKAVDTEGNIYFCEAINNDNSGGQFCDENGCVPLDGFKTPE